MDAATPNNSPRRSRLMQALAAALMAVMLSVAPPMLPQAEAANASLQALEREAQERAERRRPVMILFPAGVAVFTLILVLTIKRRR